MSLYKFDKSMEMFQRAAKVIPGGIPGHKNPAIGIPGAFPYFADRGKDGHYWDVDGNDYIDFLCGYGPIILGHNYEKIEKAAAEQAKQGTCFNHPTERTVELAERLVKTIKIADWAVFGRNGSDVTTFSILVAREYTSRKRVLMAKGAYHGSHAWSTPGHGGLIEEDINTIHHFNWNDANQLNDLVKRYEGEVAAVILTPYHHPAFGNSILPAPGFWQDVRRICDDNGIVLICDDVRAGFRLDLAGSSEYFGFKPDLACYSKAIANGFSLSAAVGTDEMKNAASNVFFTGSYYTCAVELAASLATLDEMENLNVLDSMMEKGKRLQAGLKERAEKNGLQVTVSGPPTIPYMTFSNETNFLRQQLWAKECVARGVLFHPHHNWFICYTHTDEDIDKALDVADEAFAIVKKEFGS